MKNLQGNDQGLRNLRILKSSEFYRRRGWLEDFLDSEGHCNSIEQ